MAKQPDDDSFADSTMSFGEHIEELRGALARALLGLVFMMLFGFYFASDVVRWIESPLKDALGEYYVKEALEEYRGHFTPEQLTLIQSHGMAPESIQIETSRLFQRLRELYPNQLENIELDALAFTTEELADVELDRLCEELASGAEASKGRPKRVVWDLLDTKQQETIRRIAAADNVTNDDRKSVTNLLNQLLGRAELHRSPTFQKLSSKFRGEEMQRAIASLQDAANENPSTAATQRVNRWVLAATYDGYLPRPAPKLMDVPIWKSIDAQIVTLSVHEAFIIWFKAAILFGFMLASPWIIWQIWAFVAAGLYPHEKGYVYTFLPFSLGLFLSGALLAFVFVFPFVLNFLFTYNQKIDITPNLRLSEWMSFALFLPLGFGISFQLPLVMLFLERIGVFTIQDYLSKWRIAVLVICVLSMFLTPADPSSMLMMAIPLTALYFGGVGLCKWMPARKSPVGSGYDP